MSRKRSGKYDSCVQMYERGLSIQEVGDYFDVTRQAMHYILKRRGCKFREGQRFGAENHFFRGTKADGKAQNMLEYAIRKGIVDRKFKCEESGDVGTFKDGRTKIQAHHADYNQPLKVMWLCQKCHHKWHKHNKSKGGDAR